MKNLLLTFSVLLSHSLFSQEFLSIHISDSASNSSDVRTHIDLRYQDIDEITAELKISSILMLADLDYYLVIDDSTTKSYENHPNPSQVNLKKYKTTTGHAFVVISGTDSIDGKYILDDFLGELNTEKVWENGYERGCIAIQGDIYVPFEGHIMRLNLTSPRLLAHENIINDPLYALDVNQFEPSYSSRDHISSDKVILFRAGASAFDMSKHSSAESALASYNVNSDLLDYDGDGYAAWRDDDDNNPSINQANNIYTLPSALNEIASLEAQKNAALSAQATAEAERDARPTQASYDAVVAERDAKLSIDEVKDLRAGSTMIEIHNGQATLTMEVEESDDLGVWTTGGTASVQINVQPGEDKKFFRFKMDDSDSSSDETGVEIPLSYVDLVVNLSSEGSYDFISVSNHPLNDYNGVYYTQPDLINNMPYFKSSNQKYLYFYKGASGGLLSWSFYNALPDGISDLFTGGWIHPYPVLESGNFNIFETAPE